MENKIVNLRYFCKKDQEFHRMLLQFRIKNKKPEAMKPKKNKKSY